MKRCSKCGVEKPLSEFYNHPTTKDGKQYKCKRCQHAYREERRKAYPEKRKEEDRKFKARHRPRLREASRLKRTGVSPAMFTSLLADQRSRCAICFTPVDGSAQADHCHTTNEPRGLLCRHCNLGLGHFKDSIDRLRNAIAYLQLPPTQCKEHIVYE